MENLYVIIKGDTARLYQIVTDELDNGRYHLYDFLKENVRHTTYNSIQEVEETFESYKKFNAIDYWAKVQTSDD